MLQNDLTGVTVSGSYGRLVQVVNNLYYDGFGNPLTIGGGSGPQGVTGPQGTTGANGLNGATGPQGSLTYLSTGVKTMASPGITVSSATTFNVSAINGYIVNDFGTFSDAPIITSVNYAGAIGLTSAYLNTSTETYLYLDSNSVLRQQSTFLTPQQRRQNIYIGKIGHPNKINFSLVFNEPDIQASPISQLRDMFTAIKLINDGINPSPNGANLSFNTSSGKLWGLGVGYIYDNLSPSLLNISGKSPVNFQYRLQIGGSFSSTNVIDPINYDNAGILAPIGGGSNNSTNQRIYILQDGSIRVQYGQTIYPTLTAAIAAASTERFVVFPNFKDNGILIGILSLVRTATDLSNDTQAKFLLISKFGETVGAAAGLSTTTLQQAYNNSSEPEIITNSTLDGVTFRRGTAADTDSVFQVQNGAGANTFYVLGNGNTYLSSLHITGLTGSTLSLYVDQFGNVGATASTGNGTQGPQGPQGIDGANGAGGALGYYGSFYSLQSQTNPTGSIPQIMPLELTYETNGIILYNSGIKFQYSGTYNIQFSAVYGKDNSSLANVDIWFALNGNYITASNTQFTMAGSSDQDCGNSSIFFICCIISNII